MRKLTALLLAVIMCAMMIGCASSADKQGGGEKEFNIVGEWKLVKGEFGGEEKTLEELAQLEGSDSIDLVIIFNEDGTIGGHDTEFGQTVELSGTWEKKDDTTYVMTLLDRPFDLKVKDGYLVTDAVMSGVTICFEKQ
ncbi:MAG: hypothetical protein IJM62_00150 [Lachnospiraceae bacterium]|nr:hypothetical protein [Lachnospiraceae bacterium]